jgi:hypothetical protein
MIKGTIATVPAVHMMPSALAEAPSTPSSALSGTALLRDDFSRLPVGWLTYPYATQGPAIQENQWIDARARKFGQWSNGVADQDAWMISTEAATEVDSWVSGRIEQSRKAPDGRLKVRVSR